jgi:hypothetical protein
MTVARRWIGLGSFTRNRCGAPRLDKGGAGMVRGDREPLPVNDATGPVI